MTPADSTPRNSPTPSVRELELLWEAHEEQHKQLATAIDKAESAQQAALKAALADHHREHEVHAAAHEQQHIAHSREHSLEGDAVDKASSSTMAALKAALDDHHREHQVHEAAHGREHAMNAEAIRVADTAMTARLASLNEFREQLRDQAKTFASTERIDAMAKDIDRRIADTLTTTQAWYENNRHRIETIEKGDVKSEGKGMGQASVIAVIVGAVAFTGSVLGLLIVGANLLSATP